MSIEVPEADKHEIALHSHILPDNRQTLKRSAPFNQIGGPDQMEVVYHHD
jgi:hypothetical protein